MAIRESNNSQEPIINEEKEEFVKKTEYDAKVEQIENVLKEKITAKDIPPFPDIPEIPDHSIYLQKKDLEPYALQEQIPKIPDHSIYLQKEDLQQYALKENIPKPIDTSNFATKEEIPTDYLKKSDLPDLNIYALKEEIPTDYVKKEDLPDHSIYALKQEIPTDYIKESDIKSYAKKEDIPNLEIYVEKKDLPKIPEGGFVEKSEIYTRDQTKRWFVRKEDLSFSHCMVKLQKDFRIYDNDTQSHEFYMGQRGDWKIIKDTHKSLSTHEGYFYTTPFPGLFIINFCFTCRRYTHLFKPHVSQRIRHNGGWEFPNFEYFDNPPASPIGNDVATRSFIKKEELLLPAGVWIKFSMEFSNRSNLNKKTQLHAVGSEGGFTPTYFSISGIKQV